MSGRRRLDKLKYRPGVHVCPVCARSRRNINRHCRAVHPTWAVAWVYEGKKLVRAFMFDRAAL